MKTLKRISLIILVFVFSSVSFAQEKRDEKLQKSVEVLKELAAIREYIPKDLMQKSEGIVVIPNLIKVGLGIGGQRGKGVAMVKKADGSWSDPVFITLTGGSIGFQAGVQAIDLVMFFTKGSILTNLGNGEFTLGGNISVAAGPIGRSSSATTGTKLEAEVYSYSRSKGLFAGLTLNGSRISPDEDANKAFYGAENTPSAIFNKNAGSKDANVTALKGAVKGFH
ncbi:lipid-binding SYLF domain-containing protein [Pedobacter sp. P351]|uniref:lipid-binding SYLF domain-containing protein n=1 Tax=Pedobacter superstes TaxID=3133441 RepID=UPI0030B2F01E